MDGRRTSRSPLRCEWIWMDGCVYFWFQKLLFPAASQLLFTGPVVLFLDGHHLHISLELIWLAKKHDVHLLCLSWSTTQILQPLDVGTVSSVKKARKILKMWKLQTRGQAVSKEAFSSLISELWESALTPVQCVAGFGTRLYPLSWTHVVAWLNPSVLLCQVVEDNPNH